MKFIDSDLVGLLLHVELVAVVNEFLDRVGQLASAGDPEFGESGDLVIPSLDSGLFLMVSDPESLSLVNKLMGSRARSELDLGFGLVILRLENDLPPLLVVLLHSASKRAVTLDDFLVEQEFEDPLEDLIVGLKFNSAHQHGRDLMLDEAHYVPEASQDTTTQSEGGDQWRGHHEVGHSLRLV